MDEPKTSEQRDKTQKTEESLATFGTALLGSTPASGSQSEGNHPQQKTKRGNHIMWPLVAMGTWVKSTFGFLDKHDGSITALATVAIVVLTSFYVGYSKKQWQEMRISNDTNREALVSVQRASVSLQNFEYHRIQPPNQPNAHIWSVIAMFVNEGATNAINVEGVAEMKELPGGEPTEEQFKGPYKHLPITGMGRNVARGITITPPTPESLILGTDLGPAITPENIARTHFNPHLYIWGWVCYRDVFRDTKPHLTEFCIHVTGSGLVTLSSASIASGMMNFNYEGCVRHNCDDDYCGDYEEVVALAQK